MDATLVHARGLPPAAMPAGIGLRLYRTLTLMVRAALAHLAAHQADMPPDFFRHPFP